MTAKTYNCNGNSKGNGNGNSNSKGKAGEEKFYIPPIAMGPRWMGHPIIFACVERMGHTRLFLPAGEDGTHPIIFACVEIDQSR
jgi:hypothetical protein